MLSFFKCVLCSVLINVHELVLKMNVENMHGEKIKTAGVNLSSQTNTTLCKINVPDTRLQSINSKIARL